MAVPWTTGAPGGGRSDTRADSPGGTLTWMMEDTAATPPCLIHAGFISRSRDTVEAVAPACLRNASALNTTNPEMKTERKRAGTESRNHAQMSVPMAATMNPHVGRVASTDHGTSTRSSTSSITWEEVISLISASLVRIIRCMKTLGASSLMSSGMT